jgi:hypothetical protein
MKQYIDVETGIGKFTVELLMDDDMNFPYSIWDDQGEVVADGTISVAFDSLRDVAEAAVGRYIRELDLVD